MPDIDLSFPHRADPQRLADEYERDAREQAGRHGLRVVRVSPRELRIEGLGMDVTARIEDAAMVVRGTVGFPASLGFKRILEGYQAGLPALIARCEAGPGPDGAA